MHGKFNFIRFCKLYFEPLYGNFVITPFHFFTLAGEVVHMLAANFFGTKKRNRLADKAGQFLRGLFHLCLGERGNIRLRYLGAVRIPSIGFQAQF